MCCRLFFTPSPFLSSTMKGGATEPGPESPDTSERGRRRGGGEGSVLTVMSRGDGDMVVEITPRQSRGAWMQTCSQHQAADPSPGRTDRGKVHVPTEEVSDDQTAVESWAGGTLLFAISRFSNKMNRK